MSGFFTELAAQAEAAGYSREWRNMRAVVPHVTLTGRFIWPGQRCQYRWDGSGYDPGYEFRPVKGD